MAHKNANTDAQSVAPSAQSADTNTNTNAQPTLVLFKDADTLQAEADANATQANARTYWRVSRNQSTTLYWSRATWQTLKANGLVLTHTDKNGQTVMTLYVNNVKDATDYANLSRIFKDNADIFTDDTERKERERQARAEALR